MKKGNLFFSNHTKWSNFLYIMKKALTWLLILWKRLFKKPGFLIILILIPIMTFSLACATGDNGFVNIAVAFEDSNDALKDEIMFRLKSGGKMMKFVDFSSPEEAVRAAESDKFDTAWIFTEDIGEKAGAYSSALVKIYQKDDNVLLKLTREKIFCTVFPELAYNIYTDFTSNEVLPDHELSDTELRDAYDHYVSDEGLVEFRSSDGKQREAPDYLITPLRGMTAILMLMCGMAATMYFLTDEENGSFCLLRMSGRFWVMLAGNFCALTTASVFVTLSIILTGNYTSFLIESAAMLGYIIISTLFCSILGALIPRIQYFALLLPTVLIVSLAFSPIFFAGSNMILIRWPLPTYHYLYATQDAMRLIGMLIYIVIAFPLAYLIYRLTRKQTV